jgi:molybdopterin biosynthesis enzyme MoaB
MSLEEHRAQAARALRFAVITISDTRDAATDRGGAFLVDSLEGPGQAVASRFTEQRRISRRRWGSRGCLTRRAQ